MVNSSPSKISRGQRLVVRIDRLAVGGRGVARHDGLVVFVNDTAPGDEVEIEITFVKKNFAEANLLEIRTPSPNRIVPICPVAGICGGCNWQHIQYSEQLNIKRQLVIESLSKFSGFSPSAIEALVKPVAASPKEFRYRNRIQLHQDSERIGFFRRGTHEIVAIDDCPITDERLTALFPRLREESIQKPKSQRRDRFEIYLTTSGETARRNSSGILNDESDASSGSAFSQVNTEQNTNLIDLVLKIVGEQLNRYPSIQALFDLYAGSGNFTFPLAHAYGHLSITGVEFNSGSVAMANEHATRYFSEARVRFKEASVDEFIRQNQLSPESLVVLDPPRTGCGPGVMEELAKQNPPVILYISCHPVTLARDLKFLSSEGYRLESVDPVDMFPQTDHVETIALLTKIEA